MARNVQEKWFADVLLSPARRYRSFEAISVPAGPARSPGQLLLADGNLPTAAGTSTRYILLQSLPVRTVAMPALVLARDAEVNDAYIIYAPVTGGGIGTAEAALAAANIIIRRGVLATSIVSPSVEDPEAVAMAEGEPPPPPPEPVPA
jgi:hypothetical protein